MQKFSSGDLQRLPVSLDALHLGHAVDLMRKSKLVSSGATTGWEKELVQRCAVSSILHSYCALEGTINYFGYEMFFYKDSKRYVPVEKRDYSLTKFIKNWKKANALDKLELIFSLSKITLSEELQNKLRELNNLRNWIAHGFVYSTTLLLDPYDSPDNDENTQSYLIVDTEDDVDWKRKFSNSKFKPLAKIDFDDAQIALTIILEVLKIFSEKFMHPINLVTCEYPPKYQLLWKESFDIQEITKFEINHE